MEQIQTIIQKLDLISALLESKLQEQHKHMFNLEDASVFLGISKSTLYKHTSLGHITHYKPNGKLILFKKEDLNTWIEARRIPSVNELNNQTILKRA